MPERKRDEVILDSGVVAAIFFKEESSEIAEKAAENYSLITLDLAYVEVANVAWKRVVFFNEPGELMLKALKNSRDFISGACKVIASRELLDRAFKIAVSDKITIYDSLFIAASEREKVPLLTTDGKLHEKLKNTRNIRLI
ncbi:putative nucleic acid-binding protein, contains PIN domain [Candidatus Methanoperedens nitroreducens]|uniref:Putative nucleic acid-binding protein, contains PIN domain n=1 Tax=Candidatus Methanoperedens nitratireducens TaxID=1392998 RepID=A0A062VCV9_9EURY|nr:type II toxin-antitoxin system VapC family toxin [Candidatus Methanoperedens nitroreducens]KCZ73090.1 putative nucleic acid-binding protein, contains PIN domain [Candidatus Methanoperedens nitroreducens]MDJ1422964.1 type II toxin-antitoxin system VapC family toxin [Candidatus Methanoperedens sp.]